jgi:DNA repair exonuclease SbcCD ATPase subunit
VKGVAELRKLIETFGSRRAAAEVLAGNAADRLDKARRRVKAEEQARAILQAVAKKVQERAHKQIQAVVSRCLAAVFDNPYAFEIRFEKKRGKTEARPVFVRDGHEYAPEDGVGGGVLDVAAFGLRVAEVLMQRPAVRRVLILDEPFKFPSLRRGYRERVRDLLVTLAEELDFQIIIVTHDPTFEVGKVIDMGG